MNKLRYIFLFLLFLNYAYSCALCKLEIPGVHISVKEYQKDGYKNFDIVWEFGAEFSAETLLGYDINRNNIFEPDELLETKMSLEDYLHRYGYLTFISSKHKDSNETQQIAFKVSKSKLEHINSKMVYSYTIKSDFEFETNSVYTIKFFDERDFFDFYLVDISFEKLQALKVIKKKNLIELYLYTPDIELNDNETLQETQKGVFDFLGEILTMIKDYITELLDDIKQNNTISSYIWLLLFSFLYGVVHALGPGHGKSLVASYFLGNSRSTLRAANISLMIGLVHTFSAFILTYTIYFILQSVLSNYFNDIEMIATKLSALIIISIALYLLYKKFQKPKIVSFKAAKLSQNFVKMDQHSHTHTPSCGCVACNTNSTDLGVILGAGIIPCPGTITIFIFTFGLGIYFVGFLSAIFMSLGMSFVIFLAAYLSIKIRDNAIKDKGFRKILDYGSLIVIFLLGLILLIS